MQLIPRWFSALLLAGTGAVLASGLVGVVLGIVGGWSTPASATAAVAGALAGAVVAARVTPTVPAADRRRAAFGAAAAVAVAAVFVAANWEVVGGSVMVERDPGVYAVTARWLERDGSLLVDARVGPFADDDALAFESIGMYDRDGGDLEFQSNHLLPAVLALGQGVAGVGGLFHVPLLLVAGGLLAVYALAVRVTGRVSASIAAVVALALCLPFLSVARDALSEALVLLLLWSGLWLWTVAVDAEDRLAGAAAGVCLGACLAARIDAAVLLVPVPFALAAVVVRRSRGWRVALPFVLGLVPGAAVAAADVGLRSRGYLGDLDAEAMASYGLLALATLAGAALVAGGRRLPSFTAAARDRAGVVLAAAVVVVLAALWFVRPYVQTALDGDSPLVRAIQDAQGDEVDGRRRYHELSMVWQAWYLGPLVVAAAIAGAALAVRRLAAGEERDRPLLLPLTVLGAGTALYLLRPAIAPDQIWAMRRFVPAGLPLLSVLAALAASALAGGSRRRAALAAVLAIAALVAIGLRTAPVAAFREQEGFVALVDRVCDVVGPDAAVVLPEDSRAGQTLTQTVRSWCGVPAAMARDDADVDAAVDELAAAWRAEGRTLWLLDDGVDATCAGDVVASSDRFLEDTLTSAPDDYSSFCLPVSLTPVGGG